MGELSLQLLYNKLIMRRGIMGFMDSLPIGTLAEWAYLKL